MCAAEVNALLGPTENYLHLHIGRIECDIVCGPHDMNLSLPRLLSGELSPISMRATAILDGRQENMFNFALIKAKSCGISILFWYCVSNGVLECCYSGVCR